MPATRAQLAWPTFKVGVGEAMTKARVAERLGIQMRALEARLYRRGNAAVPMPSEDGWAFPAADPGRPQSGRQQPVPFWYERTIVPYGIAVGDLDERGNPTAAAA